MTYATDLGFVVGEKYKVVNANSDYCEDGDILTFIFDDDSLYPEFMREDGSKFYCNLHRFESQKTKNKPSPRYHKPRKKPPVRKKTDVVFHYDNGKQYTIKNVTYIFVAGGDYIKVEYKEGGFEKSIKIDCKKEFVTVEAKSPNMTTYLRCSKDDIDGEVLFHSTGKGLSWSGDYYEENF